MATNVKQCLLFYGVNTLAWLTIPWFTLGEHTSSIQRQCYIVSLMQLTYLSVFPPPQIHAHMITYLIPIYYLYRTHAFGIFATTEQKLMAHNAAECTICAVKAFALISCMVYFRVLPIKHAHGAPYDNWQREAMLDITKKSEGLPHEIRPEQHYQAVPV